MFWLVAYGASVVAANAAVLWWGLVPVGFGLLAPAGVYFAGATLTLRDAVHDRLGRRWALLAVLAGAGLSALLSPQLALASGLAFLASELLDLAVYAPLRRRSALAAVAASNTVGLVVDSVLFLALAFGSLEFLAGQVVGKAWVTALSVAVVWAATRLTAAPPEGGRV
jgi:queuosine precursor transporter